MLPPSDSRCRRNFLLLALVLAAIPACAAPKATAHHVGLGYYQWDYPMARANHAEYEAAVESRARALSSKDEHELHQFVRSTFDAGRDNGEEAWLDCVASLRLLGRSGEREFLPALEELFEASLGGIAPYESERWRIGFGHLLRVEVAAAWVHLAIGEVHGPDAVALAREAISNESEPSVRTLAHGLVLFRELIERGWTPELVALLSHQSALVRRTMFWRVVLDEPLPEAAWDALVVAMNDPDENVRRMVGSMMRGSTAGGEDWAAALVRFIGRDDVTSAEKETARATLATRDLHAVQRGDAWAAEPLAAP